MQRIHTRKEESRNVLKSTVGKFVLIIHEEEISKKKIINDTM